MATNSVQEKWDPAEEPEDEEEEEEALSLCDLPVTLINHDDQPRKKEDFQVHETQEEFDFSSWGGLFSKEQEMCVADEVFFQGQILPLRLSFSSEAGLLTTGFQRDDGKQFKSRSESFDHGSLIEFRSNSSRSSSLNSSSSTSSTTTTTPIISKPRIRNQFHTHPSPKPQLRASGPRQASVGNQGRKSSVWEIFRLGVVPAPEIGLQDLKVRSNNSANKNCVSRNSSSSSSNSSTKSGKMSNKTHNSDKRNHVFKQFVGKGGGLLSGCDCSIETVQSDMVMIKGGGTTTKSTNKTESTTHAMKEKVIELKKQKHRQTQGKKVMSRRRTFEWLKELHARDTDEEALLSNA